MKIFCFVLVFCLDFVLLFSTINMSCECQFSVVVKDTRLE